MIHRFNYFDVRVYLKNGEVLTFEHDRKDPYGPGPYVSYEGAFACVRGIKVRTDIPAADIVSVKHTETWVEIEIT